MNLTMTTDNLAKAVAEVKPSVATRGSLPILHTFVLEARGSGLMVGGTNLERSSHRLVVAGVDEFGATCVPAKPFFAYTKLLPKGQPVTLSCEENALTLTCGPSTATFRCLDAADYPNLPGIFDSTPYEAIRDAKIAAAQAEIERLAQEEADRVAALPDVFTYAYQVGSRPFESETFDTLLEALARWISDDKGETRDADGHGARWPKWIRDKTGAQVVADQGRAEIMYAELCNSHESTPPPDNEVDEDEVDELTADFLMNHAANEGDVEEYAMVMAGAYGSLYDEARASARLDGETQALRPTADDIRASANWYRHEGTAPIGPPPGIPVDNGDEIDITFAASAITSVPIQRQAEQQHATQDEKIEKVRAAVLAKAKPMRVTKHRFGYQPSTIQKFFLRAIRCNAQIRYSFAVKHNGDLHTATPLRLDEENYYVAIAPGQEVAVPRAQVRYLEASC